MRHLIAILALSLALAGCGGGAYRAPPAAPSPTAPVPGMPDHDGDISHRELG